MFIDNCTCVLAQHLIQEFIFDLDRLEKRILLLFCSKALVLKNSWARVDMRAFVEFVLDMLDQGIAIDVDNLDNCPHYTNLIAYLTPLMEDEETEGIDIRLAANLLLDETINYFTNDQNGMKMAEAYKLRKQAEKLEKEAFK